MQCKGFCIGVPSLRDRQWLHVPPQPDRPTRGENGKVMERKRIGDAPVNKGRSVHAGVMAGPRATAVQAQKLAGAGRRREPVVPTESVTRGMPLDTGRMVPDVGVRRRIHSAVRARPHRPRPLPRPDLMAASTCSATRGVANRERSRVRGRDAAPLEWSLAAPAPRRDGISDLGSQNRLNGDIAISTQRVCAFKCRGRRSLIA